MLKWRALSFLLFLNLITAEQIFARDVVVFDVRRPLAMENNEVLPKDYYLNAGANDGLKVGVILTVYRHQTLYDVYQNKSPGDLVVAVGELRIVHVQGDICVARLENLHKHDDYPNVDFDAIMVGDHADLGSARMAARKTASMNIETKEFSSALSSIAPQMPEPSKAAAPAPTNSAPL